MEKTPDHGFKPSLTFCHEELTVEARTGFSASPEEAVESCPEEVRAGLEEERRTSSWRNVTEGAQPSAGTQPTPLLCPSAQPRSQQSPGGARGAWTSLAAAGGMRMERLVGGGVLGPHTSGSRTPHHTGEPPLLCKTGPDAKGETQTANEDMKRCSTSLVIRETERPFHATKMAIAD